MTEEMMTQAAENETNAEVVEEVNYEEAIEAILFAAGHPVTYEKLAQTFDMSPSRIKDIVKDYAKRYNSTKLPRGVMLIMFDTGCQLCTKEKYISYIRFALGIRKSGTLSASSIETLAIIAYHQPVTRAYVDAVRGVDSSYAVTNLVERGLIEPKGRKDAPGRPMLFGTTDSFLRCFGLSSLADLPGIESEEIGKVFSAIEEKMAGPDEIGEDQISIDDVVSPETSGDGTDTEGGNATPDSVESADGTYESTAAAELPDMEEAREISTEQGTVVLYDVEPRD